MPDFTNVSIAAPSADDVFVALPEKHGFYLKPFSGGSAVTTFAESDNFANDIVGALPFSSAVEAAELVMLSGRRIRGDRTVTAENQTARVQVYKGQSKYALLADRMITDAKAALRGSPLAFARTFPDGNGIVGVCYVENIVAEGDPGADAFGYDTEFSFENEFTWVDLRLIPVFTSATPATGAAGVTQTITGTKLTGVSSVEFRTSGGAVTAVVTNFSTKTATSLAFATPAGLTAGTVYNRFLLFSGGEVAAATFTGA